MKISGIAKWKGIAKLQLRILKNQNERIEKLEKENKELREAKEFFKQM